MVGKATSHKRRKATSHKRISKKTASRKRVSKKTVCHKCNKSHKLNGGSPCLFATYPNLTEAVAQQCKNSNQFTALSNDYNRWQKDAGCKADATAVGKVTSIVQTCNSNKPPGLYEALPLPGSRVTSNPTYGTKYLYNGRKKSKSVKHKTSKRSRK
jgi:hypothetical protein